jgi:uroporphyrinogen decarboxylase
VKEAADLAKSYGAIYIYQDDGKMRDILPAIVEAGVDVASGLQPPEVGDVDLAEAKKLYGNRIALMGGLDPVYTFDMGSPERVRDAIRGTIEAAAAGGGFVVGLAEALDPGKTSAASISAAAEAVAELGTYDSGR